MKQPEGIEKSMEQAGATLLEQALRAGAEKAEVCGGYSHRVKIALEKQDFHLMGSDEGHQLGLRVTIGDRQGFACTNSTLADELAEVATRAVEIARFSPKNPHWAIAGAAQNPGKIPYGLWDETLAELPLDTQKHWAEQLIQIGTRDKRFRINEGTVSKSSSVSMVLNSVGTRRFQSETAATWGLMGLGIEGDTITSFDYFGGISRNAEAVQPQLVSSTQAFCDEVLGNLQQATPRGYKGTVVFSPRAVVDIFLPALAYHLNGRNVVEGTSRWSTPQFGQGVLSTLLSVTDSPHLVDRAGCSYFDREGTPTQTQTFIEQGKLGGLMLDHYAAHALGLGSTGHAVGSPSSLPSVGPHSLCIPGGSAADNSNFWDQIAKAGRDFLVVRRYSGQVDPVTGDFSGVAKGGEWWSGGMRVGYVKETLVAGNLFEALGPALTALSPESYVVDGAEQAPFFACDGISVTTQ